MYQKCSKGSNNYNESKYLGPRNPRARQSCVENGLFQSRLAFRQSPALSTPSQGCSVLQQVLDSAKFLDDVMRLPRRACPEGAALVRVGCFANTGNDRNPAR